eukprot:TRINITY_DN799_c0_g1_i6.p1 TRINITY_DN799_c0_g1~~TRINITY_DN799_c0_g1_i6.p1  ORF type:complete len:367 (+),score=73.53 TRINITY_DN799_c0_g1_i6:50-1150(+)
MSILPYYDLFKETLLNHLSNDEELKLNEKGCRIQLVKKVRRFSHSVLDAVTKTGTLPPFKLVAEFFFSRVDKLGRNPSNGQFAEWHYDFKTDYLREFDEWIDQEVIDCPCVNLLVELCGGSKWNKNHRFRAEKIWEVLVLMGLVTLDDYSFFDEGLLPGTDWFTTGDNKYFKYSLISYSVQMFYFKTYGMVARFDRCYKVGMAYRSFELAAGEVSTIADEMTFAGVPDLVNLPPQKMTYSLLKEVVPSPDIIFCVDDYLFADQFHVWEATKAETIIPKLRMRLSDSLKNRLSSEPVPQTELYKQDSGVSHHNESCGASISSQTESFGLSDENYETPDATPNKYFTHNPYSQTNNWCESEPACRRKI